MTGIKHDSEKPMMDLLPMAALTEVGKVLTEGARKYSCVDSSFVLDYVVCQLKHQPALNVISAQYTPEVSVELAMINGSRVLIQSTNDSRSKIARLGVRKIAPILVHTKGAEKQILGLEPETPPQNGENGLRISVLRNNQGKPCSPIKNILADAVVDISELSEQRIWTMTTTQGSREDIFAAVAITDSGCLAIILKELLELSIISETHLPHNLSLQNAQLIVPDKGRNNWRQGFKYSRLQAALLRHYTAFSEGEDRDPETNLLHLAHLTCCALFLLEHQLKGYGEDDRYAKTTLSKIKLDPLKDKEEFWKDFKFNIIPEPEPFPKWKTGLNIGEGLSTHHMEFGLQGEKND